MEAIAQRLLAAVGHHQAGRLAEAEAIYRGILKDAPEQPDALHLLGVVAHQSGRHEEAVDLIGRALAVRGPHSVYLSNLAAPLLDLGRLDEAAAHSRESIRLQPGLADAHNNLGVALRRLGRVEEAETACREAVRLNPNHIDAHCNLGAALERQGKLAEALVILRDTVRRAPGHAQARNDLGGVLVALDQPEDAAVHLREAICLRPSFVEAHNNLGLALRDLDRIDEATACFQEALRLNPSYSKARNNLGYALEIQGKLAEALAVFQDMLRFDPCDAMALFSLSRLAAGGQYRLSEDEVERMRQLAGHGDVSAEDRCRLNYALAWALDKSQAYAEAFAHCRRANELRRELDRHRGPPFDPAALRQFVDRLIGVFTPAYFERVRSCGASSELPVFIVGMPRSGTTLAEQILASHPQVHGAGELRDIGKLVETLPGRLRAGYPECMIHIDAATIRDLAQAHLRKLQSMTNGLACVVDKMPFNFLHVGLIASLFPRARIVHCRRDAADTCLSCYFQNFGGHHPFALDLGHLGRYYAEYERLMAHWNKVLPMPIFDLCYEDLTANQEAASRRLVAFCGLAWDERCLRFNESGRVVRTASSLEVRKPMYRTSVGRWKRYESELGPFFEALDNSRQSC